MTAVEYIQQEFLKKLTDDNYHTSFDKIIEQAKAMEKEQSFTEQNIQDAYNTGYADAQTNHINDVNNYISELRYIRSK